MRRPSLRERRGAAEVERGKRVMVVAMIAAACLSARTGAAADSCGADFPAPRTKAEKRAIRSCHHWLTKFAETVDVNGVKWKEPLCERYEHCLEDMTECAWIITKDTHEVDAAGGNMPNAAMIPAGTIMHGATNDVALCEHSGYCIKLSDVKPAEPCVKTRSRLGYEKPR
jgi:hypothetical protein